MADENDAPHKASEAATGAAAVNETEPEDPVPSKPATEADLEQVKEQMSSFERSTLTWTRASFAVILFTSIFIALQWHEMREGGVDTHNLAEATKKQSDITALTLRPRLAIIGLTQNQAMVNGKLVTYLDNGRLTVRIDVPNTGPFPAKNVRFFRYDNVSKREETAPRQYEEFNGEPKFILPKAEGGSAGLTIPGQTVLTDKQLSALKAGTLWATFSVLVIYEDDFGETTHHAEYCGLFTLKPENDICPSPMKND